MTNNRLLHDTIIHVARLSGCTRAAVLQGYINDCSPDSDLKQLRQLSTKQLRQLYNNLTGAQHNE